MKNEIVKLSWPIGADLYDEGGGVKDAISILKIGNIKYGDKTIEVIPDFLSKILENFKLNVRKTKVPIEIGHEDSGAYGWVKDLWIEGNFMNMEVEWNDKGACLLRNKEYAYVSPEIIMNYIDSMDDNNIEYGPVLSGVTLTNRPVQKGFTQVLEGFSEITKEEKMNKKTAELACKGKDEKVSMENDGEPEMIVDEVPEGEAEGDISSIISELKKLQDKISSHSSLKYKKGAPTLKTALKMVQGMLGNFEPKKDIPKEDKSKMSETAANETKDLQVMFSEQMEAYKKQVEEANKIQFAEMEKKFEAEKIALAEAKKVAEEKALLAEETVKKFAEEASLSEEASFVKELTRVGKLLPKQEAATKTILSETRKQTATVKLSEGQVSLYDTVRAFLSELEPVIDYNQKSTATAQKELTKEEMLLAETQKIQQEKGVSYEVALSEANKKIGYSLRDRE